MPQRPPLSKAETEIARILWKMKEGTVRQVFDALPPERKIDFSTVQTYLRRLESKGYARSRRQGKNLVYRLRVRPSRVIAEAIEDLKLRLFDGQTLPLLQYLIQDQSISSEELRTLRSMIDELEEKQNAQQ